MVRLLIPVVVALTLLVQNAGLLMDAVAYRDLRGVVRQVLPADWRALAAIEPGAQAVEALRGAMTTTQALALSAAFGSFAAAPQGVVLRLPRGLDTEEFDLTTGCFRFARRQVTFIVWQFHTRMNCL